MERQLQEPWVIGISVGVYRWLLLAYPSAFRSRYGAAMAQVFQDCCRSAFRRAGAAGLPGLWARTMLDYLSSVIEEHAQRGVDMSRETLLKLSGWALLSGPVIVFLGWAASTRPTYDPYNARSLPVDRFLNAGAGIFFVAGIILASLGVFGLLARFGERTSALGRASLLLSGMGGLVCAVGMVGSSISESYVWWGMVIIGIGVLMLGVGVFGIGCAQRRLLRSWSGVPLATMLWMPAVLILAQINQIIFGSYPDLPDALMTVPLIIGLGGLALLGYLALRTTPAEGGGLTTG